MNQKTDDTVAPSQREAYADRPSSKYMTDFNKAFARYEALYDKLSNVDVMAYWRLYGQSSESLADQYNFRDMARYAAINSIAQYRDLIDLS